MANLLNSVTAWVRCRTAIEKCFICFSILLFLVSLGLTVGMIAVTTAKKSLVCRTDACYAAGSSIRKSMEMSANPCDDFYSYCCGRWEMPPDYSKYGIIEKLQRDVLLKLKGIFEQNEENGFSVQNAVKFYESCMNVSSIEERGAKPLTDFLKEIGGWPVIDSKWSENDFDWLTASAKIQLKTGYGHILPLIVGTDPKNTSRRLLQVDQPSLLISDKILTERNENSSKRELDIFKKVFIGFSKLLGATNSDLENYFNTIIDFETKMLTIMTSREKMTDITFWYNYMTILELQNKVPQIHWLQYFQKLTNSSLFSLNERPILQENDVVLVRDLPYAQQISSYLDDKRNSRQIATYLGFRTIMTLMNHLPRNFSEVLEHYYEESGYPQQTQERWRTCIARINAAFSPIASHLYVKKYFTPSVKNEVLKIVLDLSFQFESLLLSIEWMDRATKTAALKKLRAMKVNVGYPDSINDEETLEEIYYKDFPKMGENIFENDLMLMEHRTMQVIKTLRQDPLKEEWPVSPITINAAYNRNSNSITFPAAFLQSPLYNSSLPEYMNYAAIGAIIGHEITHGFDSEGSKRDASGDMSNWWSEKTKQIFDDKAKCFIDQYNLNGLDGKRTLAENIADNGGLSQAYSAYSSWKKKQLWPVKLPGFENFSSDQMFFITYGSIWCTKYASGVLNYTIQEAEHAPAPYRLKITLLNHEGFSEAFGCKKTTLNETCSIW